MRLVYLSFVSICTTFAQDQCFIRYESLNYPPIPRHARVQGTVGAAFAVDENGTVPGEIKLSGPEMLLRIVRDVIQLSKFPVACAGEQMLSVEFRLRTRESYDPEVLAEVYEKSHYRVTANAPVANIDTVSYERRTWRSRIRRFFRR